MRTGPGTRGGRSAAYAGDATAARDAYLRALAMLSELEHPDANTVRAKLADDTALG